MVPADIDNAVTLSQAQGWPHRAEDWALHLRHGQGWVACTPDGTVIGTTLLWQFGDDIETGSLGLIIVDPQWQGRGIGKRLFNTALEHASARNLQLVATPAGIPLYQGCGFHATGQIEQRQALIAGVQPLPLPDGWTLSSAQSADREALIALDARAFGARRAALIGELLDNGEGLVLEHHNRLWGFALIRSGGRGLWTGPVVAPSEAEATLLLSHLLTNRETFVRIDIPAAANRLGQWLDSVGLPCVDRPVAMLRGEPLQHDDLMQRYALVSQALG